jgi:hypothetical protein
MALPITREDIRMFLRDYAENNILLDDVQFDSDELTRAINMAVSEYNIIPPLQDTSAADMPPSLLLLGAASWLMKSESFLQLRNQATYQDGDISPIGVDDKHQLYLNLSARLKDEWKDSVRSYKQALNMESSYGSVSSGYRNAGRMYNN